MDSEATLGQSVLTLFATSPQVVSKPFQQQVLAGDR